MDRLFRYLFVAGLLVQEIIRFPHHKRNQRAVGRPLCRRSQRRHRSRPECRRLGRHGACPALQCIHHLAGLGGLYAAWVAGLAGRRRARAGATWLLWRAHADLGRHWSSTLQVAPEQHVVTTGIYAHLRHPIYMSLLLTGIAQAMMLPNWIAGWTGIAAFLMIYFVRIPREEAMMMEHFGEAYARYQARVGGLLPRVFSRT